MGKPASAKTTVTTPKGEVRATITVRAATVEITGEVSSDEVAALLSPLFRLVRPDTPATEPEEDTDS